MQTADNKPLIGISVGDINGISFEIILKTFLDKRILDYCTPVVYGSIQIANYHRKAVEIENFHFNLVNSVDRARENKFNMVQAWDQEPKVELGKATNISGEYALYSLNAATNDLLEGKLDAIVTAPINKKSIQSEAFNFPGHTEFFKKMFKVPDVLMLMVSDELNLKVGVATSHIPLSRVSEELTEDLLLRKLELYSKSLQEDFGISKPKIAVLGLNPHAGEEGLLGDEEENIIVPAIDKANQQNIIALGPYPADGFFGTRMYNSFDGILAMYHDQGLVPFKALAFESGVNFTAGLPVVRTSPDHGTGYSIAGKGEASENSFREAVFLAIKISRNKKTYEEYAKNPLQTQMVKEKEEE